ncbi:MAG: YncE family protein [Candidatus Dormibacteria bacterium]
MIRTRPWLDQLSYCTSVAFLLAVCVFSGLGLARSAHGRPALQSVWAADGPSLTTAFVPAPLSSAADLMGVALSPSVAALPGAPNVYAGATSTSVRADLAGIAPRVYVPNSGAGTMDVIDPRTYRVVARLKTGQIPYHVTPAWDMSRLYVDSEGSGALQVIDPTLATITSTVAAAHPYNLYFTPDGLTAIVVDERQGRLIFEDPKTWAVRGQLEIPWRGVDHLDFSADGSYLLASCEYSGAVVKVDIRSMSLSGMVNLGGLPIDVRLAPDGSAFYIADQGRGGVSIVDPVAMMEVGFVPTGRGAHGFQVSRDARSLYVSNRLAGSISVLDFASRTVKATWVTGGSPDMMQLSPDGREIWVSARFNGLVYVVDTGTGAVTHRIAVGASPHGLSYFPNPGRFSLGHNGVYR